MNKNQSYSSTMISQQTGNALQDKPGVVEWTHRNTRGYDIPCEVRLVRLPGAHSRARLGQRHYRKKMSPGAYGARREVAGYAEPYHPEDPKYDQGKSRVVDQGARSGSR